MVKQKLLVGLFCLLLIMGFIPQISSAASVDLDAAFETDENDGIIHFGDQTISYFFDTTADYNDLSTITKPFIIAEEAVSGGTFTISIQHFGSRPDLGYLSNFSINGYSFGDLSRSHYDIGAEDHDLNGTGVLWVTDTWSSLSNNLLNLVVGENTIVFNVGTVGSNQNEVEVTNFELVYESISGSPVPAPSTIFLLGSGILGFVGISRRKKTH